MMKKILSCTNHACHSSTNELVNSVIVTGADGFVGRHIVQYFAQQGVDVYAVVIPQSPLRSYIDGIENVHVIEGNLIEYEKLVQLLPSRPMAFLHLAWSGVNSELRWSFAAQEINLDLSLNAVRLADKLSAQRFILPGSTMEYYNIDCGHEINVSSVPSPQNTYGAVKVSVRYLCEALCSEFGLPFIYCVLSGIYAADRQDNNVIYYTITKLLRGERPALTGLEQLWDYVHIDDVVNALYLIALKGKSGAFYAVGHGDNWALANYIHIIHNIIDPSLPLGIGDIPYKNGHIPNGSVDLRPLQRDTGYVPKIPFEQGIRQVIDEVRKKLIGTKE